MITNHIFSVDHGIKSTFLSHDLLNTGMGEIHSIFKSSFNIILQGKLIHFGKIELGISAFGFGISETDMETILAFLQIGNKVVVHKEKMMIYSQYRILKVTIQNFTEFNCRIPLIKTAEPFFLKKVSTKLEELDIENKMGLNIADEHILSDVIRDEFKNTATNKRLFDYLVGRGKGLTPSGDDILMGMYMMLYSLEDSLQWYYSLKESLARNNTTDVSQAYYQALLSGYTSSRFVEFMTVVQEGNEKQLDRVIKDITEYGHTSGWDTLYGLSIVLRSY
ncbi:DUF2877 domain-containing protein [Lacticigenium naphthae]|uniref:DUF2877 domain-containing protein n=1 Tax=Lacticigenium naphthae TaxID=515351 RepID=UPI0004061B4D|nr:DUF2877 domain-containing protein [Lacticigenium naphthae]